MQTIGELNKKTWFRLLKVIYLLIYAIIIISIIYNFFVYERKNKIDNSNSYIHCDDGKNLSLSENNIYLDNENDNKKFLDIKILCGADIDKNNLKLEDVSKPNYEIIAKYTMDWVILFKSLILPFVILILSGEIIKRIFYYIILGSLKPNK